MLWDPRREVKADPFELSTLITWLELWPLEKQYDYPEPGRCLLTQYFAAHGFLDVRVGRNHFYSGPRLYFLTDGFNEIAAGRGIREDWTFGHALGRARTMQSTINKRVHDSKE